MVIRDAVDVKRYAADHMDDLADLALRDRANFRKAVISMLGLQRWICDMERAKNDVANARSIGDAHWARATKSEFDLCRGFAEADLKILERLFQKAEVPE